MMQARYYQQEAHDEAWRYLNQQEGNPVIVLPTGAGKSLVIAMLCQKARQFDARVVVLQHRKELIRQNAAKIQGQLPGLKVGIFSAGLKSKQVDCDIVCAGIQSVHKKADLFGRRELILIDEVHLVGGSETMYGSFIAAIKQRNDRARLIGLTATSYRTGEGPICGRNKLFQRICYEAHTGDLIREGFLCPITNRPIVNAVDTSKIKVRGSEFLSSSVQEVFGQDQTVRDACVEIVAKAVDRHSILTFCAGVDHAEAVAVHLRKMTGDEVCVVTGETFAMERDQVLQRFADGSLRWLVNCDVLTTGFDAPLIDCIAILRATMSPGLFAQIVGRGLRKHDSKEDCLILDFGGNIRRHGSLDSKEYGRATPEARQGLEGPAVEKNGRGIVCVACGEEVQAGLVECSECGWLFPVEASHGTTADEESALIGQAEPEAWRVVSCSWTKHQKRNDPDAPPTLRVDYACQPVDASAEGNLSEVKIQEWICIEHQGFARTKAETWWTSRVICDAPTTVDEAIRILDRDAGRMPSRLTTTKDGKWYRIQSAIFDREVPLEYDWKEAIVDDFVPADEVVHHGSFGFDGVTVHTSVKDDLATDLSWLDAAF